MKLYIFLFGVICTFFACTAKPDFPLEPKIEYVSATKTSLNEGDSITFKLTFEDGDGNLGKEANLSANCDKTIICDLDAEESCYKDPFFGAFIIDTRDTCITQFLDLPDFEPNGKVKAVSGDLFLVGAPTFCKCGGCPTDTVVFQIVVKDALQNYSNTVYTDTIIINCF